MSAGVMLLVLFAALLHASWNAVVKSSPDQFLDITLVSGFAAACGAIALPFLPLPDAGSWPCIAASALIHVIYFVLIGAAYRSGDMSHAYPLMRGTPPLLVALACGPLVGERLTAGEWGGVLFICGGILGLVFASPAGNGTQRTTRTALLNAIVIATYTVVDGYGVRLSRQPIAYTMWVFLLTAPPILSWAIMRRRAAMLAHLRERWHLAMTGGVCTLAAYILVLWAMTQAPIAMVAALRETAIVFGTVISTFVLKERPGYKRPIAAIVILLGVLTLKLT
jgi:drug/metabolite transporter (DMT)-like permease